MFSYLLFSRNLHFSHIMKYFWIFDIRESNDLLARITADFKWIMFLQMRKMGLCSEVCAIYSAATKLFTLYINMGAKMHQWNLTNSVKKWCMWLYTNIIANYMQTINIFATT